MKITVRIYRKNKVVKRLIADRSKWRKVYAKIASAVADKWYLRVDYGYFKDHTGKKVLFKNEGVYTNVRDAKEAFGAFIEL